MNWNIKQDNNQEFEITYKFDNVDILVNELNANLNRKYIIGKKTIRTIKCMLNSKVGDIIFTIVEDRQNIEVSRINGTVGITIRKYNELHV